MRRIGGMSGGRGRLATGVVVAFTTLVVAGVAHTGTPGRGIGVTADAMTFTVTNTNDSGAGSLRQAILDANANDARDTVAFAIPGTGAHTITPASDLPGIMDSVIVDGRTQPGYAGSPLIVLDGTAALMVGTSSGLAVGAPDSEVWGLALVDWAAVAVRMLEGNGIFRGNYVGVRADGVTAGSNFIGISVTGPDVTIGGSAPGQGNVISAGERFGLITSGEDAILRGNRIGTNAAGTAAVSNSIGVYVSGGATDVGGDSPGTRNVISGNGVGVYVDTEGGAERVRITGNRIGTNAAGTGGVGNAVGIRFDRGIFGTAPGPVAPGTVVGRLGDGFRNTIAFNGTGVEVRGDPTEVPIRGNSFFANTGPAIDLERDGITLNDSQDADAGANGRQNYPRVTSVRKRAGMTTIRGTLASKPSTVYRIDLFGNAACDPTGFGEGKTLLGTATVTTNANGKAAFAKKVGSRSPRVVTATATDPAGRTSEFSLCAPTPAYAVDVTSDEPDVDPNDFLCRTAGGKCTLRAAIAQANARPGRDRIRFAIPGGGVHPIAVQSALPGVTDPLVLDGTTQRGFVRKPLVVLDGSGAGSDVAGLRAVGGALVAKGLAITKFGGAGIVVVSGRGSAISENSIRSNGELGIDLGNDGVTLNDPRDRDRGPNGRQNYPVVSSAQRDGGKTRISGSVNSRPNATFRIELFSSPACDPAQVGEGAKFLGAVTVKTNGAGSAHFSKTLTARVPVGDVVTATATGRRDGTSEFSLCRAVKRAAG